MFTKSKQGLTGMKIVDKYLTSKSKANLLRHLCINNERDFSIAELSEELNVNKSLVSRIITELVSEEIIKIFPRRNLKLCRINHDSREVAALMSIFEEENKLRGNK
jgi:Mn-dependent DtxR family transcriptional regulator